ncbi:nitrate- and nitrite sensing domain-containing protein [Allokutzneria sp. A3M-2-11 16]|uniref:sensor histidine kinase n=1 Tax=Allokutzneria sp. A3M-2-11 16 TaxID=2962043 RepID=UPI0020B8677F|nr:nitrate- and nitrite sensing domain-containing protein [Allokutzneria sp. A3M-2-11 16]MCP3800081.1 nitrate- and nitrite sensing domain-containing protein [Allokutzneria sp. A3M-2-11 16]
MTDTEQDPPASRWRLRNWRLRTKLLAVLLIPTAAALALGGLRVTTDLAAATKLEQLANQVRLSGTISVLVHNLQRERDLTVRYVSSGRSGDQVVMERQRKRVVDSVDEFRKQVKELGPELAPGNAATYDKAAQQLDRLTKLRLAVNGQDSRYPEEALLRSYSESIDELLSLTELGLAQTDNPALMNLQATVLSAARVKEQTSRKRAILLDALQQKKFAPGQLRQLLAVDAELQAARNDFRKAATSEQRRLFDDMVTGFIVDVANNIEESALQNAESGQALAATPEQWDVAATLTVNLIYDVESKLLEQLRDDSSSLATTASTNAVRDSALVLGALALAVILALFVARSLLRPLRVLRKTALAVADHQLPDAVEKILAAPNPTEASKIAVAPVPVHTTEEIGQVARSFDAVHGEAVRLAAEQAILRDNVNAMFVNLSRRSQALVERQLNLIDRLEQDEQDPDQLSNLFELDHLATRMRRNSENLLVLSGNDLTRRLTKPVPISDVIGAAVSEVEQYARVQVGQAPDLAIQGRAVNDLVHLVAELLDNATAFSDPQTKVVVRTARTRKGELAVEISDRGVGMPDVEIREANQRLAEPPDVDVAVSRRMGLFVVGRLAKRHQVQVKLRSNEDIEGGTTALVVIPADLVQPVPPRTTTLGGPVTGTVTGTVAPVGQPSMPSSPSQVSQPSRPAPEFQTNSLFVHTPAETSQASASSYPSATGTGTGAPPLTVGDVTRALAEADRVEETGEQDDREPAQPLGLDVQVVAAGGELDPAKPPALPVDEQPAVRYEDERPDQNGQFSGSCDAAPVDGPAKPAFNGTRPREIPRDDAPTERLPIYEEILSQWFQAAEPEQAAPAREMPLGEPALSATVDEPLVPQAPAKPEPPQPQQQPKQGALPKRQRAVRSAPADKPAAPTAQETTSTRLPQSVWQSPGDEGWEAANSLLNNPVSQGTTSAGLPKRVPKAQLVPGSAAPRPQAQASAPAARAPQTSRTPDNVRGRMSSFQQGLRRGRHARIDTLAADRGQSEQSGPGHGRQDEEQ